MNMRLMYITNDIEIGKIAEKAGVDWIFVDLEYIGKESRQANRNTVISAHTIDDVKNMRNAIEKSELLVRINSIGGWSEEEIEQVADAGADIIMLPYFKTKEEVEKFISMVGKRAKTCLLVETMDAVNSIDEILDIDGIDYIHVGLNDIHIERKTTFMFEFLAEGYIDKLSENIKKKNIPFGFGGMARIGHLVPPAEHILTEHYRVGSTGVILARSFCNYKDFDDLQEFEKVFVDEVQKIRDYEKILKAKPKEFFEHNKEVTKKEIYEVVKEIKEKNAG